MADREKVIKGMECILSDGKCDLMNCQYGEVGSCIDAVLSDALALLKEQQEQIDRLIEENASNAEMAEGLKELLKEQEAVVRCKDCKYNDDGECIIKAGWFPVKPDWFCADGEEKWVM